MSESYRALVVIMGLSIPLLLALRGSVTWQAIDPADYRRRSVLWVVLTLLLFLSHGFWIYALGTALIVWAAGRRDTNPLGLFFFLLFLAPPFRSVIEGFGGIGKFIDLDQLRLLSILVLLPFAVRLSLGGAVRIFRMPPDKYVLGYITLQLVVLAPTTSGTNVIRSVVLLLLDVALPYYVFSRGLTDSRRLRDAFAAYTCAAALMSSVAVFEVLKGWLLYSSVPDALGLAWGYGHYQVRAGALRGVASAGHSIVLGYIVMVALGLHLSMRSAYPSSRSWWAMLLLLAAGIAASGSRGPWVGTVALLGVATLAGPGAGNRTRSALLALLVILPILALSPWGEKLFALMPFVGNYDEGSVDYRRELFSASWEVFKLNPLLGTPYFLMNSTMEGMRQGEGIIDLVNSYLIIGLSTGLVGLGLFAGIFFPSLFRLWSRLNSRLGLDEDTVNCVRALIATLVGVLVTIATVSGDLAVALIYWCLAGAAAAVLQLTAGQCPDAAQTPVVPDGWRYRGAKP